MVKSEKFASFVNTVGGNEGDKCHYNTRLDTYGCGCQHNCKYCYAKSLLDFWGLWNPQNPKVAPSELVDKEIRRLKGDKPVRLGGMTDCFQPLEKTKRATDGAIRKLNVRKVPYLIVTTSAMVADDEYLKLMKPELAHIQVTVTTTDDDLARTYEKASPPSKRIEAIERLQREGFDVQLRLSPYIPEFVNVDEINQVKCDKVLVEFLRVNHWIKKWIDIDYTDYTLNHSGYNHLPLDKKIALLSKVNFKEISVCEDVDEHYEYWKQHVNHNPEDCCNLR